MSLRTESLVIGEKLRETKYITSSRETKERIKTRVVKHFCCCIVVRLLLSTHKEFVSTSLKKIKIRNCSVRDDVVRVDGFSSIYYTS